LNHFPEDLNKIPVAKHLYAPVGMPDVAWHYPADVRELGINEFNGTCNLTRSRVFRRGYYASVAYTDYNIGKVVDELEALGLAEETAVLVFGDHGWQLGEHGIWSKMTNFELSLRTPTIIRVPWMKSSVGKVTDALVEAIDFYPTLAELAGLPDPRARGENINGSSLLPVLANPADLSLKQAAFSQFAKPSRSSPFAFWPTPEKNTTEIMGYSVRTHWWRYTAWFAFDGPRMQPVKDHLLGRELYSHIEDDGDLDFSGESINVVDDPANRATVDELNRMIIDHIQLWPASKRSAEPEIQMLPSCSKDPGVVEFTMLQDSKQP
jgi:hypothetical protein